MSEIKNSRILYVVWSALAGAISFFISGLFVCIIALYLDIVIGDTIIAGSLGGLLFSIFPGRPRMIGKMTFAGLVAVPVGFWSAFILGEAVFSIPFIEVPGNAANTIAIAFMGVLCGAVFGAIIYGRKSIRLFAVVGGITSLLFGVFVGALNSGHWIKAWLENLLAVFGKIDLNLLAIILSFGIGIGLSVGLTDMLRQTSAGGSY